MYVGFEIENYQTTNPSSGLSVNRYIQAARSRIADLALFIIGSYNQRIVLDAEALSKKIFPEADYDVFLSHSHADQHNAVDLALALGKHGLKVFVDSTVWGFFGDLVTKIIAQTRPSDGESKDDHIHRIHADVHMMLAGALHRTIARAEMFVFVRSEKSAPLVFNNKARTFSPWLYSELQFSFHVQHVIPTRILKREQNAMLDGVTGINSLGLESAQHFTAFRVFNEHLPEVGGETLRDWLVKQPTSTQDHAMLDALYSRFDLPSQYQRKRELLKM